MYLPPPWCFFICININLVKIQIQFFFKQFLQVLLLLEECLIPAAHSVPYLSTTALASLEMRGYQPIGSIQIIFTCRGTLIASISSLNWTGLSTIVPRKLHLEYQQESQVSPLSPGSYLDLLTYLESTGHVFSTVILSWFISCKTFNTNSALK